MVKRFIEGLKQGWAEDGPILAGLALVWAAQVLLLASQGVNGMRASSYFLNLMLYVLAAALFAVVVLARALFRARPDSPLRYLGELLAADGVRVAAHGVPMLVGLVVFMPVFSAMKSAIPLFNSYHWDPALISADRAIHGTDAWRVLQPVLGFPIVTSALSFAYHAWVSLIYAGSMYFCFITRDRALRSQYFIGFFAIWTVIGVALATGLASVGPCFVGPMFGDHRFDAQMAYLVQANEHYRVLVLPVQQQLLAWQQQGAHGLGSGISAMPSMHVAMAFLFATAIRRRSKLAGALGYAFTAVIMMASVHLGYHYAVDGYVSIVVASVVWLAAGWLVRPRSRDSGRVARACRGCSGNRGNLT